MRNKFAKAISVAASALISLSFFSAFPAAAEDSGNNIEDTLTDGMFKYELLDDGTYTITGYDATSISTIPSTRNGKAITAISDSAFFGCSSFTDLVIPDSIKTIGVGAFCGCTTLTSVTLPKTLQSLGENAFANCTSLTSVTVQGSITTIPDYAFMQCDRLTEITLPDTITDIGVGAFYECTSARRS